MKLEEASLIALAEWSERKIMEVVAICAADPMITAELQKLDDGELASKLMIHMAVLEAVRQKCEARGL